MVMVTVNAGENGVLSHIDERTRKMNSLNNLLMKQATKYNGANDDETVPENDPKGFKFLNGMLLTGYLSLVLALLIIGIVAGQWVPMILLGILSVAIGPTIITGWKISHGNR